MAAGGRGAGGEAEGAAVTGLLLPRIGSIRHPGKPTLGEVIYDVADQLGLELFDWQAYRAAVSYELEPCKAGKRLAAGVCLTLAGRQTGKTTAVTTDVAMRCLAPDIPELALTVGHPVGAQRVAFTAQDRIGALNRWYEHVDMIMGSDLGRYVKKLTRKNGEECLYWHNGSTYRVITPSKTGARGHSLDCVVIDEALAHEPWLLDVMAPTMGQRDGSASSFGAQLIIVSNAGDERAHLLNEQRELGRRAAAEDDCSRVHLEWSCADDDDPLDRYVWQRTIPTLDRDEGLSSELLARQAETIGTDAFAREYLCKTVWSQARRVIPADVWSELPYRQVADAFVVAVEVDNERTQATIVAAGPDGDGIAVKVVEARAGVDWIPDYVAGLGVPAVIVDRAGPASTLIPALEQIVLVHRATSNEVADAAAGLVDAIHTGRVGHTGDPRFQDAITMLGRRQRGDRWVFDRSRGDVGPIVGASLAVWLLDTQPAHLESAAIY